MRAEDLRDLCLSFTGSELDGSLPEPMVRDMVEDSYDLVVSALPRTRRRALHRRGAPSG